jgi:hypothetical protein
MWVDSIKEKQLKNVKISRRDDHGAGGPRSRTRSRFSILQWVTKRSPKNRADLRRFQHGEKNIRRLQTSAPADEQTIPTIAAMINSKGHRLCEVGSLAASTTTRARTATGTAAPTTKITGTRRALPNARAAAARTAITSRPAPYKVSGSETFARGRRFTTEAQSSQSLEYVLIQTSFLRVLSASAVKEKRSDINLRWPLSSLP